MALLPADIPTGLLTGQYHFVNEDTIEDGDANPQLLVVTGKVTITASVKTLRMSAKKAVVVPLRFDCKFNNNGELIPDNGDGIGLRLPATDATEFDVQGWTYTARFDLTAVETGFTVNLDPITFQMPKNGTVDLSEVIPSAASSGVVTLRGQQGVQGEQGEQGIPGVADDASMTAIATNPATAFHAQQTAAIEGSDTARRTATRDVPWPEGLVAFWDFTEAAPPFKSKLGLGAPYPLVDGAGSSVTKDAGVPGPFGSSARFGGVNDYLTLPGASTGALSVAEYGEQVTVVGWVRRENSNTGFVGGMWQEDDGDPRRQYGMFLSLPTYGGEDSVCGHVSKTGGASPGIPYSRDYSASGRRVGANTWRMVAFTYDGKEAKSYLDGVTDSWPSNTEPGAPNGEGKTYDKNPYLFWEGLNSGSRADFTVGAVKLTSGMGNFFTGWHGGLAVFNRALTAAELYRLHLATKGTADVLAFDFHTFWQIADGDSQPPRKYGWKAVRGAAATATDDDPGNGNYNVTPTTDTSTGNRLRFLSRSTTGGATPNTTNAGFGYFETVKGLRLSQVKEVTFRLNNSLAAIKNRLCICVDGTWYATEAEYGVTGDGRTLTNWGTAETKTVTISRAAAGWRDLTFTRGTTLTLAGAARSTDIPGGEVTGIGIYTPAQAAGTLRLADLKLVGF